MSFTVQKKSSHPHFPFSLSLFSSVAGSIVTVTNNVIICSFLKPGVGAANAWSSQELTGRTDSTEGARHPLPTGRVAGRPPPAKGAMSVVCALLMQKVCRSLKWMDTKNFLTVLFCEESPRFRQGRHGGKKRRKKIRCF